jgi:glycosyltransferase involved in cell wall biosynthesis
VKILMSAFSCGPGQGSDPGIGWNMALETARLGHDVVVLTQTEFQADIERELASGKLPANLCFEIFMPAWLERLRDAGLKCRLVSLTWHVVSVLWQFCVLFHARRRYARADFDLVHHVSLSGIRYPTLLTRLGPPTVIGPLGGGETAPMALRRTLPWKDWSLDLLRDVHNWSLRVDPMTRTAFRDARLIVLRTEESLVAVPPRYRSKVHITVGLGIAEIVDIEAMPRRPGEPLRVIYAGRLISWKGVHLAIRALAHALAQGADATLTVVGDGPARGGLEKLASGLGIAARVVWHGEVPRRELLAMYDAHHVFLFPSLHDAGGTVILEAWAHALPVICLALGGPGKMVNDACGRVVPVANRSEADCVAMLGAEILALDTNEGLRLTLGRGAIARCREFSWPKIVAALYTEIDECLQRDGAGPAYRAPRLAMPRNGMHVC